MSSLTKETIARELGRLEDNDIPVEVLTPRTVSPVDTPFISSSRPETRSDASWMSGDDHALKLLRGNMHIRHTTPSKHLPVYISGGVTGNII